MILCIEQHPPKIAHGKRPLWEKDVAIAIFEIIETNDQMLIKS